MEYTLDLRRVEATQFLPREWDGRVVLLEELYDDARRALGIDHRFTSRTGRDYAIELPERARYEDARTLVEGLLAVAEERATEPPSRRETCA